MNDDERYRRARARVEQLRGLYIHAVIYLMINLGIIAINLLTSPGIFWFVSPLLGWGIGLAAHPVPGHGAG